MGYEKGYKGHCSITTFFLYVFPLGDGLFSATVYDYEYIVPSLLGLRLALHAVDHISLVWYKLIIANHLALQETTVILRPIYLSRFGLLQLSNDIPWNV